MMARVFVVYVLPLGPAMPFLALMCMQVMIRLLGHVFMRVVLSGSFGTMKVLIIHNPYFFLKRWWPLERAFVPFPRTV